MKEIDDFNKIDYSKVWFLNELESSNSDGLGLSYAKSLLSSLESKEYDLIHSHKDYTDIYNSIKEKV